jgi:hypothetical protein
MRRRLVGALLLRRCSVCLCVLLVAAAAAAASEIMLTLTACARLHARYAVCFHRGFSSTEVHVLAALMHYAFTSPSLARRPEY